MAEPPAKRAKRMDSSTMWDMSDKGPRPTDRGPNDVNGISKRNALDGDDSRRGAGSRLGRRQRSRSRDRDDRRRERSRSRDRRNRDVPRGSRHDGDRDYRSARDRDRSRSRDRENSRQDLQSKSTRNRDTPRTRSRSRSRSPARNGAKVRTRSPPRGPKSDRNGRSNRTPTGDRASSLVRDRPRHSAKSKDRDDMELDGDTETDGLDQVMLNTMGFASFRSTQNTQVPGNQVYGVRKEKKTEYRQYMNRTGGFNRPLSPSR